MDPVPSKLTKRKAEKPNGQKILNHRQQPCGTSVPHRTSGDGVKGPLQEGHDNIQRNPKTAPAKSQSSSGSKGQLVAGRESCPSSISHGKIGPRNAEIAFFALGEKYLKPQSRKAGDVARTGQKPKLQKQTSAPATATPSSGIQPKKVASRSSSYVHHPNDKDGEAKTGKFRPLQSTYARSPADKSESSTNKLQRSSEKCKQRHASEPNLPSVKRKKEKVDMTEDTLKWVLQSTPAVEEPPVTPPPKPKTPEQSVSPNGDHPKGSFIEVQNKAGWVTRIYSDGSSGTPTGRHSDEKGHSSDGCLKRHVGSHADVSSKKKPKLIKKVHSQTSPSFTDVLNIAARNAAESKKRENVQGRTRKQSHASSETETHLPEVPTTSQLEKGENIDVQKVERLFKASLNSPNKHSSEPMAKQRVLKQLSVESSGTCNSTESERKSSVSGVNDDISLERVEQLFNKSLTNVKTKHSQRPSEDSKKSKGSITEQQTSDSTKPPCSVVDNSSSSQQNGGHALKKRHSSEDSQKCKGNRSKQLTPETPKYTCTVLGSVSSSEQSDGRITLSIRKIQSTQKSSSKKRYHHHHQHQTHEKSVKQLLSEAQSQVVRIPLIKLKLKSSRVRLTERFLERVKRRDQKLGIPRRHRHHSGKKTSKDLKKQRLKKRGMLKESSTDTDVPSTVRGKSCMQPRKLALSESSVLNESNENSGVANLFHELSSDPQRDDEPEVRTSITNRLQESSPGTPSLDQTPKTLKPAKSSFSLSKLKQKFGKRLQAVVQGDTTDKSSLSTSGNESDCSIRGSLSAESYRFGVSDIIPLEAVAQDVLFEETVATEEEFQEDGILQETNSLKDFTNLKNNPDGNDHPDPEGLQPINAPPNSVSFSDNCPDVVKSAIESKDYNDHEGKSVGIIQKNEVSKIPGDGFAEKVGKYLHISDKLPSCKANCLLTYTVTSYTRDSDQRNHHQEERQGSAGAHSTSTEGQQMDHNRNLAHADKSAGNPLSDQNGNMTAETLAADTETLYPVSNDTDSPRVANVKSLVSTHRSEARGETNMACSSFDDDYVTADDISVSDPGTPLMDERADMSEEDMPTGNAIISGAVSNSEMCEQQTTSSEDHQKCHRDPGIKHNVPSLHDLNARTGSQSQTPAEVGNVSNGQLGHDSNDDDDDDNDSESLPDIAMTTAGHGDPDVSRDDSSDRDTPSPTTCMPEDLSFSLDSSQGSQPHANPSTIMQDISSLGKRQVPGTPSRRIHSFNDSMSPSGMSQGTSYRNDIDDDNETSSKKRKIKFSLEKMLNIKKESDSIAKLYDRLKKDVSEGGFAKRLDEVKEGVARAGPDEDDDENEDFLGQGIINRNILSKFNIAEDKIPEDHPGEDVFDRTKLRQVFCCGDDQVSLKGCGFQPTNPSALENLMLRATTDELVEMVRTCAVEMAYHTKPCPSAFMLWLFRLMSMHTNCAVVEKVYQCLWTLLNAWPVKHPDHAPWAVTVPHLVHVLVNFGASCHNLLPPTLVHPEFEEKDIMCGDKDKKTPGERAASLPSLTDGEIARYYGNNLIKVLKIFTQTLITTKILDKCPYSEEQISCLVALVCKTSLDKYFLTKAVQTDFTLCLAALLDCVPEDRWNAQAERLCHILPHITTHHHNMVYVVQLVPLYTERGRFLTRQLAYMCLKKLCAADLALDEDEYHPEPKIQHLLKLLPACKPKPQYQRGPQVQKGHQQEEEEEKETDFYRLNSLIQLLDLGIGNEALEPSEKEDLQLMILQLKDLAAAIREKVCFVGRSQVKDLIVRTTTKLTFMDQAIVTDQVNLFNRMLPQSGKQEEAIEEHFPQSQEDAVSISSGEAEDEELDEEDEMQ